MKLKSIEEIDKDIKVISNSLEKETCALQSLEQQILEIRGPKSSSNESEDLGNGVWNEVKGLMFKKRKQLENKIDACREKIRDLFRRLDAAKCQRNVAKISAKYNINPMKLRAEIIYLSKAKLKAFSAKKQQLIERNHKLFITIEHVIPSFVRTALIVSTTPNLSSNSSLTPVPTQNPPIQAKSQQTLSEEQSRRGTSPSTDVVPPSTTSTPPLSCEVPPPEYLEVSIVASPADVDASRNQFLIVERLVATTITLDIRLKELVESFHVSYMKELLDSGHLSRPEAVTVAFEVSTNARSAATSMLNTSSAATSQSVLMNTPYTSSRAPTPRPSLSASPAPLLNVAVSCLPEDIQSVARLFASVGEGFIVALLPRRFCGRIVGKGGKTIKHLRAETRTIIEISDEMLDATGQVIDENPSVDNKNEQTVDLANVYSKLQILGRPCDTEASLRKIEHLLLNSQPSYLSFPVSPELYTVLQYFPSLSATESVAPTKETPQFSFDLGYCLKSKTANFCSKSSLISFILDKDKDDSSITRNCGLIVLSSPSKTKLSLTSSDVPDHTANGDGIATSQAKEKDFEGGVLILKSNSSLVPPAGLEFAIQEEIKHYLSMHEIVLPPSDTFFHQNLNQTDKPLESTTHKVLGLLEHAQSFVTSSHPEVSIRAFTFPCPSLNEQRKEAEKPIRSLLPFFILKLNSPSRSVEDGLILREAAQLMKSLYAELLNSTIVSVTRSFSVHSLRIILEHDLRSRICRLLRSPLLSLQSPSSFAIAQRMRSSRDSSSLKAEESLTLTGSASRVQEAFEILTEALRRGNESLGIRVLVTEASEIGLLVGKSGSCVKQLESRFGVSINVSQDDENPSLMSKVTVILPTVLYYQQHHELKYLGIDSSRSGVSENRVIDKTDSVEVTPNTNASPDVLQSVISRIEDILSLGRKNRLIAVRFTEGLMLVEGLEHELLRRLKSSNLEVEVTLADIQIDKNDFPSEKEIQQFKYQFQQQQQQQKEKLLESALVRNELLPGLSPWVVKVKCRCNEEASIRIRNLISEMIRSCQSLSDCILLTSELYSQQVLPNVIQPLLDSGLAIFVDTTTTTTTTTQATKFDVPPISSSTSSSTATVVSQHPSRVYSTPDMNKTICIRLQTPSSPDFLCTPNSSNLLGLCVDGPGYVILEMIHSIESILQKAVLDGDIGSVCLPIRPFHNLRLDLPVQNSAPKRTTEDVMDNQEGWKQNECSSDNSINVNNNILSSSDCFSVPYDVKSFIQKAACIVRNALSNEIFQAEPSWQVAVSLTKRPPASMPSIMRVIVSIPKQNLPLKENEPIEADGSQSLPSAHTSLMDACGQVVAVFKGRLETVEEIELPDASLVGSIIGKKGIFAQEIFQQYKVAICALKGDKHVTLRGTSENFNTVKEIILQRISKGGVTDGTNKKKETVNNESTSSNFNNNNTTNFSRRNSTNTDNDIVVKNEDEDNTINRARNSSSVTNFNNDLSRNRENDFSGQGERKRILHNRSFNHNGNVNNWHRMKHKSGGNFDNSGVVGNSKFAHYHDQPSIRNHR